MQRVGDAALGDLLFLHAFKERALGARRGAVDFVRQEDVGEDRALDKGEAARLLVENAHAGDIRREQIGRELHTGETAVKRLGEGFREGGFARSGHVLQQHMAAGEQGGQHELGLVFFADDHLADAVNQ